VSRRKSIQFDLWNFLIKKILIALMPSQCSSDKKFCAIKKEVRKAQKRVNRKFMTFV
jgi:hypothetical protein